MFNLDEINFVSEADAYTIASNGIISDKGREKSVYYMANRYSPKKAWPHIAKDDRMVFYGMSHYINWLMANPVTSENLLEMQEFMEQAKSGGGSLPFDINPWRTVLKKYGGYLPIAIEALPEGAVFYPHQPIVQVTSLEPGCGEMAAHVEKVLVGMISNASARATLVAHWHNHLCSKINEYCVGEDISAADMAQNFIHDFGGRASSCPQESKMFGMAHLLFFNGTDTFSAAFRAWKLGEREAGKSIMALAHRIVQSFEKESYCYAVIVSKDDIVSCVADCYDFRRAVVNYLIPLAQANPDKIIVVRPDSGNAVENAKFIVSEAIKAGLYTNGKNGYEPKNIRFIEGNSVTPESLDLIFSALNEIGANPVKWFIAGVGGYLRNQCTRDVLSSKYALCSIGEDYEPVMKVAEGGKESIPGPFELIGGKRCPTLKRRSKLSANHLSLVSDYNHVNANGFQVYYNSGQFPSWLNDFPTAKKRARENFVKAELCWPKDLMVKPFEDTINRLKEKYV